LALLREFEKKAALETDVSCKMRDEGGVQRRTSHPVGLEVGENFKELESLFQAALERIADVPDSAAIRVRLERAKAAAIRGGSLAQRLSDE